MDGGGVGSRVGCMDVGWRVVVVAGGLPGLVRDEFGVGNPGWNCGLTAVV